MHTREVILVNKTHLDIGFTDLPSRVTRQYLDQFIPGALELAESSDRFIWTTGSWLIWKALEESSGGYRRRLETAIGNGLLRWHALPYTLHTELADASQIRAGLSISHRLDERFGLTTRSAKMTDVPGHTIGLVPLLADAGVSLLHLGVNPSCRVPEVPEAFRWRHPDGSEVTVFYGSGYGDAMRIPGSDTVLAFLHTNDNLGPPSNEALNAEYAALQARYPSAAVRAGTMEDVVDRIDVASLPVLEQEIGDSWIHGVGSAPQLVSDLRAIQHALADDVSVESNAVDVGLEALMVVEHTWGLDAKGWIPDHRALAPAAFAHERRRRAWRVVEQAYAEQDACIEQAVSRADGRLKKKLQAALDENRAVRCLPRPGKDAEPADRWLPLTTPRWVVRFDPANGVIRSLFDRTNGVDLCDGMPGGRLGILKYELLGARRFRNWVETYLSADEEMWWAAEDFDGPRENRAEDLVVPFRMEELWREVSDTGTILTLHLAVRHPEAADFPVPPNIGVQWFFPDDPKSEIEVSIGWDEKPAALVREALWFGLRAGDRHAPKRITVDKLDTEIDTARVVKDGALLHVTDRATMSGNEVDWTVTSLDAVLMCPDGPRLLDRRLSAPDLSRGTWWNLFNTGWSTNFSYWIEGAMGYRFRIGMKKR